MNEGLCILSAVLFLTVVFLVAFWRYERIQTAYWRKVAKEWEACARDVQDGVSKLYQEIKDQ